VCCYEVGEEVRAPYRARFGDGVLSNGHLDLRAAAERALREAGVEHVSHVADCTACDSRRYFSHRRDGPGTGRQGVIAYVA
jgi:copper oxidase (laccase) domain-containing protein